MDYKILKLFINSTGQKIKTSGNYTITQYSTNNSFHLVTVGKFASITCTFRTPNGTLTPAYHLVLIGPYDIQEEDTDPVLIENKDNLYLYTINIPKAATSVFVPGTNSRLTVSFAGYDYDPITKNLKQSMTAGTQISLTGSSISDELDEGYSAIDVENLWIAVNNATNDNNNQQVDIDDHEIRLNVIEGINLQQNTRLTSLESRVGTAENNITNILNKNSEQDMRLNSAETHINQLDSRITTLDTTLDKVINNEIPLLKALQDGDGNVISETYTKLNETRPQTFSNTLTITGTLTNNSKSFTLNDIVLKNDITTVYKYKGSVPTYNDLPVSGLTTGDVYNIEDTGDNYAWDGSRWDRLAGTVDLSSYATIQYVDTTKVEKTSLTKQLYGTDSAGNQTTLAYSVSPTVDSIVIRDNAGNNEFNDIGIATGKGIAFHTEDDTNVWLNIDGVEKLNNLDVDSLAKKDDLEISMSFNVEIGTTVLTSDEDKANWDKLWADIQAGSVDYSVSVNGKPMIGFFPYNENDSIMTFVSDGGTFSQSNGDGGTSTYPYLHFYSYLLSKSDSSYLYKILGINTNGGYTTPIKYSPLVASGYGSSSVVDYETGAVSNYNYTKLDFLMRGDNATDSNNNQLILYDSSALYDWANTGDSSKRGYLNTIGTRAKGIGPVYWRVITPEEVDNKIEAALINIPGGSGGTEVELDTPAGATSGTITSEQLRILQSSKSNYINYDNQIYRLQDNEHDTGMLTYTYSGHSNDIVSKTISITISTLAWTLSTVSITSAITGALTEAY